MGNDYQDSKTAKNYINFLNSANGQIQQKVLFNAISGRLPKNPELVILDAGCGSGWLAGSLKKDFPHIEACDAAEFFIESAKKNYPGINFKIAALAEPLPYPEKYFDVVILNMVAPDLKDLNRAFASLCKLMKPGAKLLMAIPNPKYSYPAAEWKRSWLDVVLWKKPKLVFKKPPLGGSKIQREFGKNKIDSYYYTLDNYLDAAEATGLQLFAKTEIKSQTDSPNFDLNYQLYRYPLLQLYEFKK
jgi:2-polyprenyl-3-methyl-5-hydroxy-6-metoxy-1,4-benzoquinol methylase